MDCYREWSEKSTRTLLLVAAVWLSSLLWTTLNAQTKLAFIAGVEDYERDGFEFLQFAEDDALELKMELTRLGFETQAIVGREATLDGIQRGLDQLYERSKHLRRDDIVLVFLSGHGVQKLVRRNANGTITEKEEPFFCPVDAHKNDVRTLLNLNDLLNRLKEDSGASNNIVLLDACRESLDKGAKGIDGSTIEALPNKLALFFAAQSGHRSFESRQLKHGIFSYYLLEGLRGKAADEDNEITLQGLASYVSKRVQRDSPGLLDVRDAEAQQPNFMGNLRGSLLLGKGPAGSAPTTPRPGDNSKLLHSKKTGLEMVKITAGTFTMGSPSSEANRGLDETEHRVTIAHDFYIGKYEVTQAEFVQVMGYNPSKFKQAKQLPVENLSWYDAVMFCNKLSQLDGYELCYNISQIERDGDTIKSANVQLISGSAGYRLPTEAQWEYACRANSNPGSPFSFGATITTAQVNYDGSLPYGNAAKGVQREKTLEVGSMPGNAFDLFEMHGNVGEWCSDWYEKDYYSKSPLIGPRGPATGSVKVNRGGSWNSSAEQCRSAQRSGNADDFRSEEIGFRVVCQSE